MRVIVGGNQGRYWHFQGLMKSSLVPVLLMEWAPLSFPPPSLLSLSDSLTHSFHCLSLISPYPSLSPSLTNSPNYKAQRIWRTGSPKGSCLQNQVHLCLYVCKYMCVCVFQWVHTETLEAGILLWYVVVCVFVWVTWKNWSSFYYFYSPSNWPHYL